MSGPDHDMLDVEKRNVRHGPGVLDKSRIVRQEPMSVAQVHEAVAREGLELLITYCSITRTPHGRRSAHR